MGHLCPYCRRYYCLEHRDPKTHDCLPQNKSDAPESEPTRAVTEAVKPQNKNKDKKKLLTIHFTFLENKKRSSQEQTPARIKVLEPQPSFKENNKAAARFAAREIQLEDSARARYTETLKPPTITEESARAMSYPAVFESALRKFFAVSFVLVVAEEVLRLVSYVENPPFLAYLDGNLYVRILNGSMAPHVASLIVFAFMCSILFVTAKLASLNQNTSNSRFSLLKHAIPFGVYVAVSITYIVSITNWIFILKS